MNDASARPRWLSQLQQFYGLKDALSVARQNSYKESDPGYAEFVLACSALADARELDGPECSTTALLVYGDAVALLLHVLSLRLGTEATEQDSDNAFTQFRSSIPGAALLARLTGEERAVCEDLLGKPQRESVIAQLTRAQRDHARAGLRTLAFEIANDLAFETLPLRRIQRTKVLRVALTLLLPVLLVFGAWHLVSSRSNLALGKRVTLSSSSDGYGVTPEHLVDGDRTALGFHTEDGLDQYATVDLGRPLSIRQVHVYNRTDCCPERAIPLRLEVSLDGATYTRVAHRDRPFLVWKAAIASTQARFVRVLREGGGCFHLAEVEVYR